MRHLKSMSRPKGRQAIPGASGKFNLFSTLYAGLRPDFRPFWGLESVDAGGCALYNTAQWRQAQSCRRCSLDRTRYGFFVPEHGIR
jgi:hypothetical protein